MHETFELESAFCWNFPSIRIQDRFRCPLFAYSNNKGPYGTDSQGASLTFDSQTKHTLRPFSPRSPPRTNSRNIPCPSSDLPRSMDCSPGLALTKSLRCVFSMPSLTRPPNLQPRWTFLSRVRRHSQPASWVHYCREEASSLHVESPHSARRRFLLAAENT